MIGHIILKICRKRSMSILMRLYSSIYYTENEK